MARLLTYFKEVEIKKISEKILNRNSLCSKSEKKIQLLLNNCQNMCSECVVNNCQNICSEYV